MRLIDADALIEQMKENPPSYGDMDRVIYAVEDAPTVSGWISVKDRLPEGQFPVLVYVPSCVNEYGEEFSEYVGMAYYTYSVNGGWWGGTDGCRYGAIGIIQDPVYWMPLPEPPKGD